MKLYSWQALNKNRELLWRLCEREVVSRYRGSLLGWSWTLLQPIMMLAVYTFVFSTVFKARWPDLSKQVTRVCYQSFSRADCLQLASECIGKLQH